MTRAEGDFNQQVGSLRQKTNKDLPAAADRSDEAEKTRADKASETEK